MSFWNTSGYRYREIVDIQEAELARLTHSMSREDLIEWLSWNDPNGIYRDDQSLKELGNIMSREEGIEILLKQCGENRILK